MRRETRILSGKKGREFLKCGYALTPGAPMRLNISFFIGYLNDKDIEYIQSIYESTPHEYKPYFTINDKEKICLYVILITGETIEELFTKIDTMARIIPFAYHYISDDANDGQISQLKKDIIASVKELYLKDHHNNMKKAYDYCTKLSLDS